MADRVTFVRVSLDIVDTRPASSIETILRGPPCGIHRRAQETVWVATYNASGNLHTVAMVAQGGFDAAHVHIPALMNIVALSGANRFLVAHNHPNGYSLPSQTDLNLTAEIAEAAEAIDYDFDDHLIFDSRGGCTSLARTGVLLPRTPPAIRLERRPA
jgi:DNA repair protein RadC